MISDFDKYNWLENASIWATDVTLCHTDCGFPMESNLATLNERGEAQEAQLAKTENLQAEIRELRDRLSKLSRAALRINQSLDFDIVLQEVLDSARVLTNARYGALTYSDSTGKVQDYISSGLTGDEDRELWETADGLSLFEYLNKLQEPLRVHDFATHAASLGLANFCPPVPVHSFLAAPVTHRNERIGNIFLGKDEPGRDFDVEDQEMLVMFASQVALVIANAHRFREEQRARANLQTLIDTAPVGVVVFDPRDETPISFNREARRIVDSIMIPGSTPQQILQIAVVRRADGREFSLSDLPIDEALSAGETVRAEEIVMIMPDGRSVNLLVNATPICSTDAKIDSYIMTLQDMAPIDEAERLRAEFLGMVSHELRSPLTSIKGSTAALLDEAAELDPAEMMQFHRIIDSEADRMRYLIRDLLDVAKIEAGNLPVEPEPSNLATVIDRARSVFLNGGGRTNIQVDLPADLPFVVADRRRIVQVITNLVSNADRHSPDSSAILISATREHLHVAVSVSDTGDGIPAERLPKIFQKFARPEGHQRPREVEGSGLGLAICKGIVEAHGGRIWAESEGRGKGARFTFTIPVAADTLANPATVPGRVSATPSTSDIDDVQVLIVDDDPQALRYVRDVVTRAGFIPNVTADPNDVPRLMEEIKPHLLLLDLMLPGCDGIELMERLPDHLGTQVIFVSAYGQDQTIAKALRGGAVDYVVKPFSPTELIARLEAALRRHPESSASDSRTPYEFNHLKINYDERAVALAGQPLRLTASEYQLLYELSINAGRALTHEHLVRRVWRQREPGDLRRVRTLVKRLRQKLNDDGQNPTYIFTEPRVGYRMIKPTPPS